MRLTKQLEETATNELLVMLNASPAGLTTAELIGTPRFHGHHTLSRNQVIRILKKNHCRQKLVPGSYGGWRSIWTPELVATEGK
jgi:hypothetical protein